MGSQVGKSRWKFATDEPPAKRKQRSRHSSAAAAERATVGKQSRRHTRPEAIPERQPSEFVTETNQEVVSQWTARIGNLREPTTVGCTKLPQGARIIRVIEQNKTREEGGLTDKQWQCEFRRPWSEDEFFKKAVNTPHPMEAEPIIPDRTKIAILNVPTQSAKEWTTK